MSNDAPKPPSLNAAVRTARGLPPKTFAEEMAEQFEARLRANGGKWVPLTAAELSQPVQPPPDMNTAVKSMVAKRKVEEEKKRNRR
jgi:hypothetical protein